MFCYSNDLNMYLNAEEKIHKQIQNIQSKTVRLESILARKYQRVSIKVMAENRRQALLLQEYEELAEAVSEYPCLYDKAKKEYKDKIVTKNVQKDFADQLIFIENGKLKKLRHLPLTPVEILLSFWEIS